MKYLILILFLFSCSKADDIIIEPIEEPIVIEVVHFKTGRYSGKQTMNLHGNNAVINTASREIYPKGDSLVIRWWSVPDTVSYAMISDTISYDMVYDRTNTSCGLQRSVYSFKTVSYMVGDSLFEKGTVHYKFWYEGNLLEEKQGTFYSKLKFIDSRTPNRYL